MVTAAYVGAERMFSEVSAKTFLPEKVREKLGKPGESGGEKHLEVYILPLFYHY